MADEEEDQLRAEFASRMHEICDDMDVPMTGRQSALARLFQVSNKAARRWLEGLGYPEMAMAIRIANWAGVNLTWLLQGAGPKRGNRVDGRVLVLDEALRALTRAQGTDLIDSLRAKLVRIGKLQPDDDDPSSRYRAMLEAYENEFARKPQ